MLSSRSAARISTMHCCVVVASLLTVLVASQATANGQIASIFAATPEDGPCALPPGAPKFSIKGGSYSAPVEVRLTAHARGAVIFYTTDGWTPTSNSTRYMGPIAVDKTTTVQAIALVPNCSISKVAMATYEVPSAPQPMLDSEPLPVVPSTHGAFALRADMQIPLVFASPVDSRTAQVGDGIAFTLAEDLKIGDALFAPKGTPAKGRVIQVDRSGVGDTPGEIQFQVDSLNVNGTKIPLRAMGALAGRYVARASTTTIGAVTTGGLSLLFEHGKDARIPAGAPLTATMVAGTLLSGGDNLASNVAPGTR